MSLLLSPLFSPLRHCSSLNELYLRRNRISSVSELAFLRHCAALKSAWFADNPLCQAFSSIHDYRLAVIGQLPQVRQCKLTYGGPWRSRSQCDPRRRCQHELSHPPSPSLKTNNCPFSPFLQLTFLDNVLISDEERNLAPSPLENGLELAKDQNEEEVKDHSELPHSDLSLHASIRTVKGSMGRKEVDDDDDDDDEESQENDEKDDDDEEGTASGRESEAEILASSLRFCVAESNSIREKLGLAPIHWTDPLWSETNKNRDVSTEPLVVRSLVRSLARSLRSLPRS